MADRNQPHNIDDAQKGQAKACYDLVRPKRRPSGHGRANNLQTIEEMERRGALEITRHRKGFNLGCISNRDKVALMITQELYQISIFGLGFVGGPSSQVGK